MENSNRLGHRKNFFGSVRLWLCVLAVALVLPLAARAQDTGSINGTVTDKSGAAVVGAEVVLTNLGGSLTRTTTTNADGLYVIAGLPGATYNLVITAKGFQKFRAEKIVLNVGDKSRVDVQLIVGAVTEVVEVTGEAVAQVETSSSDLSSTITGKQVDNLVLNGRNFTQLVTLAPGVVNQTGQDEGTVGVYGNVAYSMNGGRTEYNNWELDGGDNMDNGSNATLNVYPNPEAISEFKILTSNYGAQYGRNGSGTVEVETKSGTTSFHGSAFEYLRNDMFNARPWDVAGGANPPYKKHDYGYTIGGPVYIPNHYNTDKRKTFFFFSEEWRKEKNPSTVLQNVPSDNERTGNFSDLCPASGTFFRSDPTGVNGQPIVLPGPVNPDCPATANGPVFTAPDGTQAQSFVPFPGNQVTVDPVGQALLALIPNANPGLTNSGFPAVRQTVSLPTNWREELFRIDHKITEKYQLTFRYIHDSWTTTTPNALWGNGSNFEDIQTTFVGPGTSFVARLNANITPTLLNEFVASYTADHIFLTAIHNPPLPSGFTSEMGTLFPNQNPLFGNKLPTISLGSNAAYGGCLTADTGYFPWNNANPTYTYRDNLTKIAGKHTLTIGVYLAFAQKNEDNSPYVQGILTYSTSSPISTGNSFADLLVGNVARYQQSLQTIKYYNRYKIVEPYFQDDWRMTKRLTLNLGLRLSLFGTYRERYQRAFNFDPITAAKNMANAPAVDDGNGDATTFGGALIPDVNKNPFYGIVQCGGKGGTFTEPGFQNASVAASSNAGCLNGHLFNPAPRIGFAFDPKGDGKMAIRGGYGIFFEHTNGNEAGTESLEGSPPLGLTQSVFNVSGYSSIGGGGAAAIPFFPLSVFSIPNQARFPYVQQWHLDVQKDLPSHIVGTISYVGSKGTHLTLQRDINQLHAFTGTNPFAPGQPIDPGGADCANIVDPTTGNPSASATLGNGTPVPAGAINNLFVACGNSADLIRTAFPAFSTITSLEPQANSIYNALQATAHRTVGDLQLSVAYTYSHSLDDSSDRYDGAFVDSYNVLRNRASSDFDQRHSLAVSYIYALPFHAGSGVAHHVLGGWQVSGITIAQKGTPFSVTNSTTFGDNAGVGNGVGTGSRPDLVGNPHMSQTNISGIFGPLIYNPAAFTLPTGLTFGDVGRNTLRNPGRVNFDFGLFKRFSFGEQRALDFRWENFNIFNHTQTYITGPAGNNNGMDCSTIPVGGNAGDPSCIGSSSFLHAAGAHAPRRMQFALRFQF